MGKKPKEYQLEKSCIDNELRNFAQSAALNNSMMIDLVNLQDFQMNTDTWQASVGAGYRLDNLDQLLHSNGGRAISHGTCPGVGVGGHATVVSI